QVVNELRAHCHKSNRTLGTFNNEDLVFQQHVIAEIILVLVKKVTFGTLKFRKRLLARDSPKDGYRIEIFGAVIANNEMFWHVWK
ncbi:MAG TPA: hypothetical protein VFS61_07530, partial [Anaerolineales bacterium]|nr:hypothetical protein [Anaerolineales bacterium]